MRIGIVNDMPLAVEALRRAIATDPALEVAWVARDGAEAVELCLKDRPQLVLMDLIMPGLDGVEATRRIMERSPCAILIVTASVGVNTSRVYDAMGHGALDAIDTPVLVGAEARAGAAALLAKIETIGRLIGERRIAAIPAPAGPSIPSLPGGRLLAIGASAGGPAALTSVLATLPRDLPAAVVLIQHVDAQFAAGMAAWLSRHSSIPVRVAQEGDVAAGGVILLAGTSDHLVLKTSDRLGYTPDPRDYAYRPSVDVFFHSVRKRWAGEVVAVLLTGMGRDGAAGLKAIHDRGWHTLAQDRATSAVYGMPKAAAELGAAGEILPLDRIGPRAVEIITRKA